MNQPSGEWWDKRQPGPYVSPQMLWYRSDCFFLKAGAPSEHPAPHGMDAPGGDDITSLPYTRTNPKPHAADDRLGASTFANLEKKPAPMASCLAQSTYKPVWSGPTPGWATELLPPRPGAYAETLLGPTSRPITSHEQEQWAPRVSTPRHKPLCKPDMSRDPIWGVKSTSVRDLPAAQRFQTTARSFAEDATRIGLTRTEMISPATSDQMRGRHHVDPRGPYKY